jgi:hypothetical protein
MTGLESHVAIRGDLAMTQPTEPTKIIKRVIRETVIERPAPAVPPRRPATASEEDRELEDDTNDELEDVETDEGDEEDADEDDADESDDE